LGPGEAAFVVTPSGAPVNFKLGDGTKTFAQLPWYFDWGVQAGIPKSADTDTVFPPGEPGFYLPTEDGTYDGVTVDLSEGVNYLIWDGASLSKIVYPIDLSGYVRYQSDGYIGDMSLISTGNPAVDRTYILPITQTGKPSSITVNAFRAGAMKFKVLNRSGSDFSFVREFTVAISLGINTIDVSQFLLDLSPTQVLGFRYDGPTTATGLIAYTAGGSMPMFYINGDFTASSPTAGTSLNTFNWAIRVDYPVDSEVISNSIISAVNTDKVDNIPASRMGVTGFYGNIQAVNTAPPNPIQLRTFLLMDESIKGNLSHIIINATRAGTIKIKIFEKLTSKIYKFVSETTKTLDIGYNSVVMDYYLAPNQFVGWEQDEPSTETALVGYRNQGAPVSARYGWASGDITSGTTQFEMFNANFDFAIQFFVNNHNVPDIMGQNIAFIGDSITSESQGYTYALRIRDWSLARSYSNVAIGGATWAWRAGTVETDDPQPGDDTNVLGNQVLKLLAGIGTTYATPDVVFLSAGINDVARGHPIGDIDMIFNTPFASLDQHDFIAAIRWSVETLYDNIPNVRIFLLTPLHSVQATRNFTATKPYSNAIIAAAERLNVPVIDCFREALIYESRASVLLPDGLHPNSLGQMLMSKYVFSQIKSRYYKLTI
jgi:lysophospholipase L1-like esterase